MLSRNHSQHYNNRTCCHSTILSNFSSKTWFALLGHWINAWVTYNTKFRYRYVWMFFELWFSIFNKYLNFLPSIHRHFLIFFLQLTFILIFLSNINKRNSIVNNTWNWVLKEGRKTFLWFSLINILCGAWNKKIKNNFYLFEIAIFFIF